jgi:hypothetical protein
MTRMKRVRSAKDILPPKETLLGSCRFGTRALKDRALAGWLSEAVQTVYPYHLLRSERKGRQSP